jgi:hypothetical protein
MTDVKIALRELLEKGSDATVPARDDWLRCEPLEELETEGLCGAAYGERTAERHY